jgi:predicted O-methyltransferase YrrM
MQALLRFVTWRLGFVSIESWSMPEESACLVRHATGKHRLAEVGVWEGGMTRRMRSVMASDATLFAIDPFPTGRLGINYQELIAHGEVARVPIGRVVWLPVRGADAGRLPEVTAALFDFVFIDSDHTYEGLGDDWAVWSPQIAPGGIVALHDSASTDGLPDYAESQRFTRDHILTDVRFALVETACSLTVLRRT